MQRLSLTARLAVWFALITVLVFGVGGGVLYQSLARQIRAQGCRAYVAAESAG